MAPDLNTLDPLLLMNLHRRMSVRQTAPGSLQEFLAETAKARYNSARNRARTPVASRLRQAEMLAWATRCKTAFETLQTTMGVKTND